MGKSYQSKEIYCINIYKTHVCGETKFKQLSFSTSEPKFTIFLHSVINVILICYQIVIPQWIFSLFLSLVNMILYRFCSKEKFCLNHSRELKG